MAAIAVITKSGWDTPALRMATKTHHPDFEQMQRKDNALRDAASEIDILRKRRIMLFKLIDFTYGMHHRGVIAATEVTTNLLQAESGVSSS